MMMNQMKYRNFPVEMRSIVNAKAVLLQHWEAPRNTTDIIPQSNKGSRLSIGISSTCFPIPSPAAYVKSPAPAIRPNYDA